MDEDYEWEPPSEAELKVLEARRERADKISKIMGDYLLKGYKMLGSTCEKCDTILLQDRQGKNYCIACQELDSDVDKDNPVLSESAAKSQVMEGQRNMTNRSPSHLNPGRPRCQAEVTAGVGTLASNERSHSSSQNRTVFEFSSIKDVNFGDTVETLCQKISWATDELRQTAHIDYSIQLCQLIKACADAVQSLRTVHNSS